MPRSVPAVALSLVLLLSGCGASESTARAGAAVPWPAPSAATAWAETFCRAMNDLEAASHAEPKVDPTSSQPEMDSLVGFVSGFLVAVDKAIATMKAIGPSPTPSGDAAVTTVMPTLVSFRRTFAKIKKDLAGTDVTDADALDRATAPLARLSEGPDPSQPLRADPELNSAARKSASCRRLYSSR